MSSLDLFPVEVAVIGSGVVGLSIAWQLAEAGHDVAILDAHPARGASYAAAGMLAPVTEAVYGEERLAALTVRAAMSWPSFATALEHASGFDVGYRAEGTLLVALDRGDRALLTELLHFQQANQLDASWESPSACRTREPLLSPEISGGIWSPSDHQVDNRRLLAALAEALRRRGVREIRSDVDGLQVHDGAISGVTCEGGVLSCQRVIVSAGVRSRALVSDYLDLPVRPVKGQILRLFLPEEHSRLSVTVRGLVRGQSIYLVPRSDGHIVVGATVEEMGEDTSVTAGAVYELLRDALRILPVLSEAHLEEALAGLRPASGDNAPILGGIGPEGLYVATGHYRHGVLFAPLTAEALCAVIEHGTLPSWAAPLSPERFS